MKRSNRAAAILLAAIVLTSGCAGNAYQRTRQTVIGAQAGIVAAGPVLDVLEAEGAFTENPTLPAELRERGGVALLSLETALQAADALQDAEQGRRTLASAVSSILVGVDDVLMILPESERLSRIRSAILAVQTALLVANALAAGQ